MNALLACPHCQGAISRTSRTCPSCGRTTVRGQQLVSRKRDTAPQSVFMMALDALHARGTERRSVARQIREVVRDA